ncbi:hypothetical protein [Nocardioides sp.]|uniref:hypothetical protein n=1 Tax=Nocardioides sp. TaxID=35761 RepID=UPI0031FEC5D0|nr:hypothetical protein [Nocardioides sp.]
MRPGFLLILLVAGVTSPWPSPGASASCVGPSIDVLGSPLDRPELARATPVIVAGQHFVNGCNDTGSRDAGGCDNDEQRETEIPLTDVELTLQQGRSQWSLGSADAGTAGDNELGQLSWEFELPAHVRPGAARLLADGVPRLAVLIR